MKTRNVELCILLDMFAKFVTIRRIFFSEGPRSRCYGSTAALRLIVQPCDEDEEKDGKFFFFIFPSNGAPMEWN
jgi:hypothetical protein